MEQEGSISFYNYAKRNLCLFHKSGLTRVTDDNKGVKYYHSKPYCIPIQSGFIPLVAGSLKDQIALLVYCFLYFKSMDIR